MFYGLYSAVRDIHGDHTDAVRQARTNAGRIISIERRLHVFHEQAIQHPFLSHHTFIRFWDAYYGTVHFVAVAVVLVGLFVRFPDHYRLARNTLAITTALALVGFSVFPLLPPRLLGSPYHFVDTIDSYGGLWSLKSEAVSDVSNLYAAMPSLHTAWSTWCAAALWPRIRRRALRPLLLIYPLATVFCIVITANHYFADAVGGLITLGIAYAIAQPLTSRYERWHLHLAPGFLRRRPAAPATAQAGTAQAGTAPAGIAPAGSTSAGSAPSGPEK